MEFPIGNTKIWCVQCLRWIYSIHSKWMNKANLVMETSQQMKRNSFKWSFTPFFVFLTILGLPADALLGISRVPKFVLLVPIFLSLSLNFTFNIFNILNETFNCCFFNSELASHNLLTLVHNYFIRGVTIPVLELWVVVWFVFHFYVTRRYHKIWSPLQKMEQELVLNAHHFYRRCRNRCIFLISFATLVNIHFNINKISYSRLNKFVIIRIGCLLLLETAVNNKWFQSRKILRRSLCR